MELLQNIAQKLLKSVVISLTETKNELLWGY